MSTPRVILLLSGSLRAGSSNETVLRTAQAVAPAGVRAVLHEGPGALPHFNPDDDVEPLPGPVAGLRAAIGEADALLICTPEYAGTLPGAFKNLLDWTVGGTEICDKPVAWVSAAAPGRGQGAEATLRTVLGYTGASVVEEACVRVPVDRQAVGADGIITEAAAREQLAKVLTVLAESASAPTPGAE
ncbi:NAD(P)H-dependent oxidoreductase [Streptomyces sp. RKAG290]|uniref:NADPH-dependent FMN reductase n=1 Tax=Streptomyces sp. RKAG290 TaxID=2888348 RepID=UPI002033327D|nr:NAD(P)H-dependent oxidoreductase [Streptomyces sp. RKAG290]MCM2413881.1 NAD(P)H-dependent oxidoreductase [Streptomyces sp. RKAG290]